MYLSCAGSENAVSAESFFVRTDVSAVQPLKNRAALGRAQTFEGVRQKDLRQLGTVLKCHFVNGNQRRIGQIHRPREIGAVVERLLLNRFQMDGVCKIGRRQVKQPQLVVVGDGVLGLFLARVSCCERFKRDVCHRLTVDGRRDGHGQKEIVFVGIDLLKPRFPYAVNRTVFKGQPFRRNLERRAFAGAVVRRRRKDGVGGERAEPQQQRQHDGKRFFLHFCLPLFLLCIRWGIRSMRSAKTAPLKRYTFPNQKVHLLQPTYL